MKQYILTAIIGFILGFLLVTLLGCTVSTDKPAAVTAPTGTSIDKAGVYVSTADYAVQQARPHADPVGQADLGIATNAHKSAQAQLSDAKTTLASVQNLVDTQTKTITSDKAVIYSLLHSWGHRLQVFVTWAFWIIVVLVAVHFAAIVATCLLPPPYSGIASLIGKIVNPFGWTTWLLTKLEINVAANATAAPAVGSFQTVASVIK